MIPLYIAADTDLLKVGDMIRKDDDPKAFCLLAFQSVDDALLAGGYRSAIYGVTGTPCNHGVWRDYSFGIMVPNGGYSRGHVDLTYRWGERSGPFFWPFPKDRLDTFDALEVVQVLQAEVFGPNGAQVVHALKWYRSKFSLQSGLINPIASMDAAFTRMWAYYDDRIGAYGSWWNSSDPDVGATDFVAKKNAAKPTAKAWLQPWKTVEAWNECHLAAARMQRAIPCEWLEMASAGMSALAVRDSISHRAFNELWRGMEDIIPIAELDRQVPPVLH